MSLGQIIRKRREQLGLTQDRLSSQAGISKPYLSNIETGRAKNPPSDPVLIALERGLGFQQRELLHLAHLERAPLDIRQEHEMLAAEVQKLRSVVGELLAGKAHARDDLDALLARDAEGNVRRLSSGVAVPVINRVAAGYPHHFTDLDYPPSVADEYIRCPDMHDPQAFAARVVGDSMEPKYREGDVVVFSPAAVPKNGDDCFVRFEIDAETTFKRFYQDNEQTIRLQPLNDRYPSATYRPDEVSGLWPAVYRIEHLRGA